MFDAQCDLAALVYREGENPDQVLEQIGTKRPVAEGKNFGIGRAFEFKAGPFDTSAQRVVIINFPVIRDCVAAVAASHRLDAACDVDNGKTGMPKTYALRPKDAVAIRTAPADCIHHPGEQVIVAGACKTRDAAHRPGRLLECQTRHVTLDRSKRFADVRGARCADDHAIDIPNSAQISIRLRRPQKTGRQ